MALFGKKKTETKKVEEKTEAPPKASTFMMEPHVAEKSTNLNAKGIYVFRIGKRINKMMVRKAIKEKYNVVPRKIAIINLPSKPTTFRGHKGTRSGFKKALVYLKPGEKIELS